ncbi:MAG: hypothetical protein AB7G75_31550 [Candidatus Binatia bacterium]
MTKNPLFAAGLSLLVPGVGQIYNQQYEKGLVLVGVGATLGVGAWWATGLNRLSLGMALIFLWMSAVADAYKTAQTFGQPLDWYYRRPYVIAMLVLVGPLALPLLWRSPYFSRAAQWLWSTFVVGILLLFLSTPYLLSWLGQKIPELQMVLRTLGH